MRPTSGKFVTTMKIVHMCPVHGEEDTGQEIPHALIFTWPDGHSSWAAEADVNVEGTDVSDWGALLN